MLTCAISVVVPTRNRWQSLRRLLVALADQTLPPGQFEVVVIDDGSSDGTADTHRAIAPGYALRVVSQPHRGRAAACNAGIRASQGAIVLLLDDDMEPSPALLATHVAAHGGAAATAILGPVPVVFDAHSPPGVRHVGRKFDRHLRKLARPGYRIGFRDFYTGNCSIRRSVLMEVGLFDEDFTDYGNEDGELAIRLLRAGVALLFEPRAIATQHYEKDFPRLARDSREKGRTALQLAAKHPDAFSHLALSSYHSGSRRWRLCRWCLLTATKLQPRTAMLVAWAMTRLERATSEWSAVACERALEYFYWVGVMEIQPGLLRHRRRSAPREDGTPPREQASPTRAVPRR